jgi:hypothetical protein
MVMVTLKNLIETPLYKDLNVTIHHQWANLGGTTKNITP